jgi:hypothetical protein
MPVEYSGTPESVLATVAREGFLPIGRAGLVTVFARGGRP